MPKTFLRCPKCAKRGYFESAGYDPSPERGPLFRCRYCQFHKRVADALAEALSPSLEGNRPAAAVDLINGDFMYNIGAFPDGHFQLVLTSTPYPGLKGFDLSVPEYLAQWVAWFGAIVPKVDPVTGVIVQVVKFKRRTDWPAIPKPPGLTRETDPADWPIFSLFDARVFQIPLLAEGLGLACIECHPWDKLNSPPAGNHAGHDRDEYEFVFAFARSPHYTYNKVRRPYSQKTVGKSRPGNKPRSTDASGSLAGGHANLHPAGAAVSNMIRASSSGEIKRPRAIGGSFPLALAERIILEYSNSGDRVLDPFFGVATTLFEASKLGRPSVGMEKDWEEWRRAKEWLTENGVELVRG